MGRTAKKSSGSATRPALESDPDGWERSWQAELDQIYVARVSRLPSVLPNLKNIPKSALSGLVDENQQQQQVLNHKVGRSARESKSSTDSLVEIGGVTR